MDDRVAILEIDPQTLRALLGLPAGCEVVSVDAPFGYRGTLHIKVMGAGWHVAEGGAIPVTRGSINSVDYADGVVIARRITWDCWPP